MFNIFWELFNIKHQFLMLRAVLFEAAAVESRVHTAAG
jgi:hypothetical protein